MYDSDDTEVVKGNQKVTVVKKKKTAIIILVYSLIVTVFHHCQCGVVNTERYTVWS